MRASVCPNIIESLLGKKQGQKHEEQQYRLEDKWTRNAHMETKTNWERTEETLGYTWRVKVTGHMQFQHIKAR